MAAVISRHESETGTRGGFASIRSRFRRNDNDSGAPNGADGASIGTGWKGTNDSSPAPHLAGKYQNDSKTATLSPLDPRSSVTVNESGPMKRRALSLRNKMRLGKAPKPPIVPSLPPALVLHLDHSTRSDSERSQNDTDERVVTDPASPQTSSAAALIAKRANVSFAATKEVPKPVGKQRIKVLEAMANARLDVARARDLVRLCSKQIKERGLDTTGLFRSFRIAQSHDRVEYLVQLYLLHINAEAYASVFTVLPENALERLLHRPEEVPDKAKVALDELQRELRYASPHDIVAVLKWGLRHMRMRASDFNSSDAFAWYDAFVVAERTAGYPARAIADLLHPKLPLDTAELLCELLELMATVAAHQHANHMPASYLCSVLGFWLFGRIGVAHPPPTFGELQEAWMKATSITEHLLLAHIRSQAAVTFSMPLRLTELVQGYPHVRKPDLVPSFAPAFASRQIHTLKVDLRSENLIVSLGRPREPSAILASALDASASETLEGGRGETWAAVMAQLDSSAIEGGKGQELLIPEHARIMHLVGEEMRARRQLKEEQGGIRGAAPSATSSTTDNELGSLFLSPSYRRRSKSYNDIHRHRPLTTLREDGSFMAALPETQTPPPPASAVAAARTRTDAPHAQADASAQDAGSATNMKRLSTEWRSFSEGGFGASSSTADLTLNDFEIQRVEPTRSQTLTSRKASGRKSTFGGAALGRRRSNRGMIPDFPPIDARPAPLPSYVVTSVSMTSMDPSLTTLWQDSLLDISPCSTLPPFILVQLDEKVAAEADLLGGYSREERPWLLINETVLPPRPPTPVDDHVSASTRGRSKWGSSSDDQSFVDSRSIFAPSIRSMKSVLKRRMSTISIRTRAPKHSEEKEVMKADSPEAPRSTDRMPGEWV